MVETYGEVTFFGLHVFYEFYEPRCKACNRFLVATRRDGLVDMVIFGRVHVLAGRKQKQPAKITTDLSGDLGAAPLEA